MNREPDLSFALADWFGIPRSKARVLAYLYEAGPDTPTSAAQLVSMGVAPTCEAVHQIVYQLRTAMGVEVIDFALRRGYRLTPAGMADCRAGLQKLGETLLAA
jgi:hypothetical protein